MRLIAIKFTGDEKPAVASIGRLQSKIKSFDETMRTFEKGFEQGNQRGQSSFKNLGDQIDKETIRMARQMQQTMRAMGGINATELKAMAAQHTHFVNAVSKEDARAASSMVKGQASAYNTSVKNFQRAEAEKVKSAEKTVGTLNRLAGNIKSFVGATRGQGSGSGESGFLPGLANVSEIIQAIPQVGQLAGAIVRPLTNAAEAGVKFNAFLETAKIGLTTLLGSEDAALQHLEQLQDFAAKTPFQFKDLVEDSQRMQAFGFESKRVIPILTAVGDALSATGEISKDALEGVLRQMGQMRSTGRVTAEDMNSITERGIPAWDLLAKAIGKSVAETRKLAEGGKINGTMAVEAIAAQMESRYGGQMDKVANTLTGRLSNLEDIRDRAQGLATQSLTSDISKSIDAALKQGDLTITIANGINSAITPVSGIIRASVTTVLGGGITAGLTDAFNLAKSTLPAVVLDMATGGVINPFSAALEINSPSLVFKGFGMSAAEGFRDGIVQGLKTYAIDGDLQKYLGEIRGKLTKEQEKSAQNLVKLMEREPQFKDKLIEGSRARGINPDHLLNVMAIESQFNKSAQNRFGYSGLIQIGDKERKEVGMPRETWGESGRVAAKAFLEPISATEQLKYVFRYLDSRAHGQTLDTQSKVYATVGAGSYTGDDETVRWRKGSRGYANNPLWDANHDGLIQNKDFGLAAVTKLAAGIKFSINGSEISASNPLPVTFGEAIPGIDAAIARLQGRGARPEDYARPKDLVGGAQYLFQQQVSVTRTIEGGSVDAGKIKAQLEPIEANLNGFSTTLMQTAHSGFPELAKAADAAFSDADKVAGAWADRVIQDSHEISKTWKAMGDGFEKTLASHLANAKGNFKSWTGALLADWGSMIKEMLAKAAASKITTALFGDLSKSGNGGGGRGLIGKLLGGAQSSANSNGGFSLGNLVKGIFGGSTKPATTPPFAGGDIPIPTGSPASSSSSAISLLSNFSPRIGGAFGFGMPNAKTFQSMISASSASGLAPAIPPALSDAAINAGRTGLVKLPSSPFGGGGSTTGLMGSLSGMAGMGLVMGGGFLGGKAGGSSPMGQMIGSAGGMLAAGAAGASGLFGAGIAGSFGTLAPLLTNPITAIVAGGLIGTALLVNHFSHRTEKALQKATKSTYGIDVRDMKVLSQIKQIGEQTFGKGNVGKHIGEVIKLDGVKQVIQSYAESTGQDASKIVTDAKVGDASYKGNQFTRPSSSASSMPVVPIGPATTTFPSGGQAASASQSGGGIPASMMGALVGTMGRIHEVLGQFEAEDENALFKRQAKNNPRAVADAVDTSLGQGYRKPQIQQKLNL